MSDQARFFFSSIRGVVYSKTSAPNVESAQCDRSARQVLTGSRTTGGKPWRLTADKYTAQAPLSSATATSSGQRQARRLSCQFSVRCFCPREPVTKLCTTSSSLRRARTAHNNRLQNRRRTLHGIHVGVSEFFIKEGATCSFTMIHNWALKWPFARGAAPSSRDATFISNYVCLKPVIKACRCTLCFAASALTPPRYRIHCCTRQRAPIWTSGARVIMEAEQCKSDVISRPSLTAVRSSRAETLTALHRDVKGHLECRGLILGDHGRILPS